MNDPRDPRYYGPIVDPDSDRYFSSPFRCPKTGAMVRKLMDRSDRMRIKAGIPRACRSIEEAELIRLCENKIGKEAFDDFYDNRSQLVCVCEMDGKPRIVAIKEFARMLGIRHWRLRSTRKEAHDSRG
jgi:hypothetical protein